MCEKEEKEALGYRWSGNVGIWVYARKRSEERKKGVVIERNEKEDKREENVYMKMYMIYSIL